MALSEEFPLSVNKDLLPILQVFADSTGNPTLNRLVDFLLFFTNSDKNITGQSTNGRTDKLHIEM